MTKSLEAVDLALDNETPIPANPYPMDCEKERQDSLKEISEAMIGESGSDAAVVYGLLSRVSTALQLFILGPCLLSFSNGVLSDTSTLKSLLRS